MIHIRLNKVVYTIVNKSKGKRTNKTLNNKNYKTNRTMINTIVHKFNHTINNMSNGIRN